MLSSAIKLSRETNNLSYGFLQAQVGSQNRLFRKTAKGTMINITAEDIKKLIPGFESGNSTMLSVYYKEQEKMIFHHYRGGSKWVPTLPGNVGRPGDLASISASILTVPDFIEGIPKISFVNDTDLNWVAERSQLTNFTLNGNQLKMSFVQEPFINSDEGFDVIGIVAHSLGTGSVSGPYLDIEITDKVGQERRLRIYFDGNNPASFGISVGEKFGRVHIVSFDGVRIGLGYEKASGDFSIASLYSTSPSVLYVLGDVHEFPLPYVVKGQTQSLKIDSVVPRRSLEKAISLSPNKNDVGRVGAEIAYTVATEELGLADIIMQDPSQPGPDLYTKDRRVLLEARLLQRTANEEGKMFTSDVESQLNQMARKVRTNLATSKSSVLGYAIFSFINNLGTIQTIVLRVPRPN